MQGAPKTFIKRDAALKFDSTTLPADGTRTAFVGVSADQPGSPKIFLNLDKLSTHTMIAGATGSGKTVAAQVLVEEALKKGISVVVFDPTAQWTGFLRPQKSDEMLSRYDAFGLSKAEARGFKGTIKTIKSPAEKINLTEASAPGMLTILCLNKLKQKPGEHGDPAANAEQRRETAQGLDKMDAMLSYLRGTDFSAQTEASELEQFVSNSIFQIFDSTPEEKQELRLLLVYDEVHRLLPKFGGTGHGFRQVERAVREFRKWGIGLVLVSQVLSDFVGEIKANIGTEIQMRTKYEGDLDRVKLKFGDDALQAVVRLPIGVGMVQNSDYNRGIPFFVAFRPPFHNMARLPDEELEKFAGYEQKISQYAAVTRAAAEKGADTAELEMELELAREKLRNGSFNIVDIYLDSIAPKIEKLKQT